MKTEVDAGEPSRSHGTAVQSSLTLQSQWLHVGIRAKELRILEGVIVEVRGRGSLQFRDARRVIRFPDHLKVLVDEDELFSSQAVGPGAEVRLVTATGETQWILRRAFSLPRHEGTRVADSDPEGDASIDTREETHFFLHVAGKGKTVFFLPGEQQSSEGQKSILHDPEPENIVGRPLLRSELDTYFERLSQFGFSGSVLVARGDTIIFVDAYGLADREDRRPFTPSTIVTIGSITKPFTATAILKLEEMDLLNLHDPISKYLDGIPPDKQSITLHHLLTHTSGLKRNGLEGGDLNLDATRSAVLEDVLHSDLVTTPGNYSYSNVGYTLLAMIVENVSETQYETFLYQRLMVPARMYRTGYLIPRYESTELAAAYRDGKRLDPVIRLPMLSDGPTWNLRGNGGLHSDAYDMFKWFLALRSYALLSKDKMQEMLLPHANQGDGEHFYGYGWEISNSPRGTRDVSHGGGNGYFAATFHWLVDEDYMFFVGSNAASQVNNRHLSETIEAILFEQPYLLPPKVVSVTSSLLKSCEGNYLLPSGATLSVTAKDSSLVLVTKNDRALQAVLGGSKTMAETEVRTFADRSRDILVNEFRGDFEPKFEAMRGTTSIESLERYHQYDRETWDTNFGTFQGVEVVAAAGEGNTVQVMLRINFDTGAAAELYTWRGGRLANISVISDWGTFQFSREVFPVSETHFESFSTRSPLRLNVYFEPKSDMAPDMIALVFPGLPGAPKGIRSRDKH